MDHQRIDDALEARPVNHKKLSATPSRRRDIARLKRRHRRLVQRGDDDSDAASGLESGPDSDDEDIAVPQSRPIKLSPRPTATLRGGFGFGVSSKTSFGLTQSTPQAFASATITTAPQPTSLESSLLAAELDDLDSDVDGVSDGDESDDDTTTLVSTTSATTAPSLGLTSSSDLLTSTTAAVTLSSSTPVAPPPPPPAIGTFPPVTSSPSSLAQTTTSSTEVVAAPTPNSSSGSSSSSSIAKQTAAPSPTETSLTASAVTPTQLSTLILPSPQLESTQTTTVNGLGGEATRDPTLGSVVSKEPKHMSQGEVAGTVIGVLAAVTIMIIAAFFFVRRLRRGPSRSRTFARAASGDTSPPRTTGGTSWAAPWNRNLWGAASSSARSTVSAFKKKNLKTNSEMLDELVQATYAAEGGAGTGAEKSNRRLTDLESQSPPSPGSFLDENFINEKSYAKLEGPWPLRNPPSGKGKGIAAAPKTPGPVARWLDGILTPRQSIAVPPPTLPPGGQMATKWQPAPPLPVAKPSGFQGLPPLEIPRPAFGKGSARDTRMTETTTTGSSVVW